MHRHDDEWIVEHIRALGLLGPDINTNCGIAHVECGKVKTATHDLPGIAKARRMAQAGRKKGRGFWKPAGAAYDWKRGRYVVDGGVADA